MDYKPKCPGCGYYDLEQGDTLYAYFSEDHGMCFDYICNIKYCPVCGKELPAPPKPEIIVRSKND